MKRRTKKDVPEMRRTKTTHRSIFQNENDKKRRDNMGVVQGL